MNQCKETFLDAIGTNSGAHKTDDEILKFVCNSCENFLTTQYESVWCEVDTQFIFLLLGVKIWKMDVENIKLNKCFLLIYYSCGSIFYMTGRGLKVLHTASLVYTPHQLTIILVEV